MKSMNSYSKSSISLLFTFVLLTEFLSTAFIKDVHIFSIDFAALVNDFCNGFSKNRNEDHKSSLYIKSEIYFLLKVISITN